MGEQNKYINLVNQFTSSLRYEFSRALGMSHKGRRDLYEVYGYSQQAKFSEMFQYARREPIANRIAFGVPRTCWRNGFEVRDDKDKPQLTDELAILAKNGLFSRLERADVLNRIGNFSVLFVGVPDGRQPNQELGRSNPGKLDQVFFKPFAYDGIEVSQFETDPTNPRYGMPKMYSVAKRDRGNNEKDAVNTQILVHWTRIVHLNENALDSDVEGMPALAPVFNRILDIDKTLGGAAEAYYRNASPKYAFEIDPEFTGQISDEEKEQFDEAAAKFTNDMQNMIRTAGANVKTLPTPHNSPMDTFKAAMMEISGNTGIPMRVLTGEGAGQLAGSEDRLAYNAMINDRQDQKCAPWAIRVLEILGSAGMLVLPETYRLEFPREEPQTEREAAEVNKTKAETLNTLVDAKSKPGGDALDLESLATDFGLEISEETIDADIVDEDQDLGE